ncbi:hypothetical protein RHSIM_Rhsim06G0190400 [Rhododendron simsii]|uniref:Terpene synthase metal-binding domain-containing protein n=1 Tax=Rhododendron simsii TaxID=118357 RepID=A0A834LJS2_RHOSS|nr:hypothetical protein RHSIM_Rhsim06G0190400 [Rhododendron simsii]
MGTAGSGRVRWGRPRWAGRYCGQLDMEVPEWEGELAVLKDMARAYLAEAKWYHDGYVPTMEEYMPVAQESSGVRSLVTVSFLGMGELATKSAFDWIRSDPLISQATEVIGRLMDDVAGHEVRLMTSFISI